MKLSNILSTLTLAIMAIALQSCLGSADEPTTYVNGSDVATVQGYSDNRVNFAVETERGTQVFLYAALNGKIDPQKYPANSRVYITYSMLLGQDSTLPVKVDLLSTVPVATVNAEQGTAEQCKLDYPQFVVNKLYGSGQYINMVVQVPKDENRTWQCFVSPDTSGETVRLYLTTTAPAPENSGTTKVVTIDAGSFATGNNELELHVNCQSGNDHIYTAKLRNGCILFPGQNGYQ